MTPSQPQDDDLQGEYRQMAEKIRSGEYFEESRRMYDVLIHDPMADRYFYIFITIVAAIVFMISYTARESLFPLNSAIPYVFHPTDMTEDLPHMKSLAAFKGEDPGEGVLRYMVSHYVMLREQYTVEGYDDLVIGVKNQSTPEVISEYEKIIDPGNPESPVALYQRHSKREIAVLSTRRISEQDFGMEVVFEASVTGKGEVKKSRWKANIAFQYSGVTLDDEGKIKPLTFTVTKYQTKRLQDAQ